MMRDKVTRILGDGIEVSDDLQNTGYKNLNTLIIGTTGSGKTRSFVVPNILAAEGSIVVTDTKGDLCGKLRGRLEAKGYRVLCIDFTDCENTSVGYNPLDYVRVRDDKPNDQALMSIAAALCPLESHEPFWDYSARALLSSILGYVMYYLPKEEWNLVTVCKLMDTVADGRFEKLIDEVAEDDPDAFVVSQFAPMQSSKEADKMAASVRGIAQERLNVYRFAGATRLFTMENRIRFADLRREKTALFLNVSDTDRSLDRLVALFYEQLFRELIWDYKENPDGLSVHAIMDDFACGCPITGFPNTISVCRSRNIFCSIIIQSIAQLETLYQAAACTICDNCDSVLFLGSNDPKTAQWIGDRVNQPAHSILTMPVEEAMLIRRGAKARKIKRYTLESAYDKDGVERLQSDSPQIPEPGI